MSTLNFMSNHSRFTKVEASAKYVQNHSQRPSATDFWTNGSRRDPKCSCSASVREKEAAAARYTQTLRRRLFASDARLGRHHGDPLWSDSAQHDPHPLWRDWATQLEFRLETFEQRLEQLCQEFLTAASTPNHAVSAPSSPVCRPPACGRPQSADNSGCPSRTRHFFPQVSGSMSVAANPSAPETWTAAPDTIVLARRIQAWIQESVGDVTLGGARENSESDCASLQNALKGLAPVDVIEHGTAQDYSGKFSVEERSRAECDATEALVEVRKVAEQLSKLVQEETTARVKNESEISELKSMVERMAQGSECFQERAKEFDSSLQDLSAKVRDISRGMLELTQDDVTGRIKCEDKLARLQAELENLARQQHGQQVTVDAGPNPKERLPQL